MVAARAMNTEAQDFGRMSTIYSVEGSGFEGMKMLDGLSIDIFHMNDVLRIYPD